MLVSKIFEYKYCYYTLIRFLLRRVLSLQIFWDGDEILHGIMKCFRWRRFYAAKIPRQAYVTEKKKKEKEMILPIAYGSSWIMSGYFVTSSSGRSFLLRKCRFELFSIMADFQYKICNHKIRKAVFLVWYFCFNSCNRLCIWTQKFSCFEELK